jgi:transcriptional regulator with XRE-family HTH domain
MSKSVLDTIREYKQASPENKQEIETHSLELDLCDRMVELRENAGLTQAALAENLGFTQGYIAKLENGAYDRCGIGTLRTFALALGCDIDLESLFKPIAAYSSQSHPASAIRLCYTSKGPYSKSVPVIKWPEGSSAYCSDQELAA